MDLFFLITRCIFWSSFNRRGCSFKSFFFLHSECTSLQETGYFSDTKTGSEATLTGSHWGAQAPLRQAGDPDYWGDGGSLTRHPQLWQGLSPSKKKNHPVPKSTHSQESFHLSPQAHAGEPPYSNFLKKEGGGGGKQPVGFRGEDSSAPENNASHTESDMARAGRDGNAPHGAASAETALKWRPWGWGGGEESRSETAQQTLAGSQRAPSSPLSLRSHRQRHRDRRPPSPGTAGAILRGDSPLSFRACFVPYCRAPSGRGAGNEGESKGLRIPLLPPAIIHEQF